MRGAISRAIRGEYLSLRYQDEVDSRNAVTIDGRFRYSSDRGARYVVCAGGTRPTVYEIILLFSREMGYAGQGKKER